MSRYACASLQLLFSGSFAGSLRERSRAREERLTGVKAHVTETDSHSMLQRQTAIARHAKWLFVSPLTSRDIPDLAQGQAFVSLLALVR